MHTINFIGSAREALLGPQTSEFCMIIVPKAYLAM